MGIFGDFGSPVQQAAAGVFQTSYFSAASGVSQAVQWKVGEGLLHTLSFNGDVGNFFLWDSASDNTGLIFEIDTDTASGVVMSNLVLDSRFANGLRIEKRGDASGAQMTVIATFL